MTPIIIRRCLQQDQPHVKELLRSSFAEFQVDFEPSYFEDLMDIPSHYFHQGGDFLVLTFDEKIIGMGAWIPIDQHSVRLQRFAVHKNFRKQGLGTRLAQFCLYQTKKKGYQTACLMTSERQIPAQNLYQQLGFRFVSESLDPLQQLRLFNYQLDLLQMQIPPLPFFDGDIEIGCVFVDKPTH